MNRTISLFWMALILVSPLASDPLASFESAWAARQVFAASGTEAGVAAWTSTSGWTEPGLWLGIGAGIDASVTSAGTFQSLRSGLQARAGVQFVLGGWGLMTPWAGGALGWAWGPGAPGQNLLADGGLDAELRLGGVHYLVFGAGYRSDGAVEVSLAFRDRTTWRLPVPPPKPRMVSGGRGVFPSLATNPQALLAPAKITALDFSVYPPAFSPDGDGVGDLMQVSTQTDSIEPVSWVWSVVAPGNQPFFQRSGTGLLPASLPWDGRSDTGELVSSATDYRIDLTITDASGRTYGRQRTITTDVLLLQVGDQYLIRLPSINFVANSPGLAAVPSPKPASADQLVVTLQDQNAEVIQRLATILKKFPQHSITIIGHANLVSWANPAKAAEEDRKESRPLSLSRAQSVKDALVKLGLEPKRIKVEGAGGSKPLFPFGDQANAWKNRRVDLILDRMPTAR